MELPFRNAFEGRNIWGVGLGGLALLLAFIYARPFLFVGLFVALNFAFGYGMGKARMIFRNVGFELVTFSTIIAGFAFGPAIGLLVGVLARFAEMLSMKRMFSAAVTVPLYALLGLAAGLMQPANVVTGGLILMGAFVLFTTVTTLFFLGGRVHTMLLFGITQAIFNTFLIIQMYPLLYRVLTF